MSLTLFFRTLWRRISLSLSSTTVQLPGLWDSSRLRTEHTDGLEEWRNQLLLQSRRQALVNGAVVTKVEHLKDSADKKWQHEFLRVHVLHEASREELVLIVDRNFSPKDVEHPPQPGKPRNGEKDKQTVTPKKKMPSQENKDDVSEQKASPRDVPEEKGRDLIITYDSGDVLRCSELFFPVHKVVDSVRRGVRDLERRKSRKILELQTLIFPDCARPSVIRVAFFLAALSEFAPRHHVGEFQGCWFARAACDGLQNQFSGKLNLTGDSHLMGMWKNASFKYTNPTKSVGAEYKRQLEQYVTAFNNIQSDAPTEEREE